MLFDVLFIVMAKDMPMNAISRYVGEHDTPIMEDPSLIFGSCHLATNKRKKFKGQCAYWYGIKLNKIPRIPENGW